MKEELIFGYVDEEEDNSAKPKYRDVETDDCISNTNSRSLIYFLYVQLLAEIAYQDSEITS